MGELLIIDAYRTSSKGLEKLEILSDLEGRDAKVLRARENLRFYQVHFGCRL